MFLMTGHKRKYLMLILFAITPIVLIISSCSSNQNSMSQPDTEKPKVIFSEWRSDQKGGFKSTVSVATLGEGHKKQLFKQDGQVDGLKVSPDNKKLAYLAGYERLHICDIGGGNRQIVDKSTIGWPNWSLDSKHLAYVHRDESTNKSILTIYNLDDRKKETVELGTYSTRPCSVLGWYPGNNKVAVFSSDKDGEESWTLSEVDIITGKMRELARKAVLGGISPDGSLSVVRATTSSGDKKKEELDPFKPRLSWEVLRGKDIASLKRVTEGELTSNLVALSPDGKRIVYSKNDKKYGVQLFVANSDGKGEQRITQLVQHGQFIPVWSPDRKSIVFSAIKLVGENPGTYLYYYDFKTKKVSAVVKGDKKPMQLGSIFAVYR